MRPLSPAIGIAHRAEEALDMIAKKHGFSENIVSGFGKKILAFGKAFYEGVKGGNS